MNTTVEWTPGNDERAVFAALGRPAQLVEDAEAVLALSGALRYCVDEVLGLVTALHEAGENHCADSCAHALKSAIDRAETALGRYEVRA